MAQRILSIMWCCVTLTAVGVLLTLNGVQSEGAHPVTRRNNPFCECGVGGADIANRIVGGMFSKPYKYPWVIEMRAGTEFRCSGSIINDRYILTAAHCVEGFKPHDLTITLSIFDLARPGEGIQTAVERIIVHPQFSRTPLRLNNDVALVKLKYPIRFGSQIRPICLPQEDVDYSSRRAVVTGWGRIAEYGRLSNVLKETEVTVLPYRTCRTTELGDQLTDAMLCAYSVNSDTCKGDSGGPLMAQAPNGKYQVIGAVSWGWGCERRHLPGVYTRIQYFLRWISDHTRDAMYCSA